MSKLKTNVTPLGRWRWLAGWLLLSLCVAQVLRAAPAERSGELSPYEQDMSAFINEIDGSYPFIVLKNIGEDWTEQKAQFITRAKQCASDAEFLEILADAIRCLRDGHLSITKARGEYPALPPQYYPGISFLPAADGEVVVMYPPRGFEKALPTGAVVETIDGIDARQYLENKAQEAWDAGGFFSSPQRARLYEYRIPLRGEKGTTHILVSFDGQARQGVRLTCNVQARGWPRVYNLPANLVRVGRSFHHTKLASGVGYMYLRRVDASVTEGMGQVALLYPDVPGWIVDLRGNSGGGYDNALIEQIKGLARPVAVVIDAGCVSAGETVARDFRSYADARLFGSRTAGSSSSKKQWTFPSGIATLRIPTRSRWRHDREPIEYNGIEPDEQVNAIPQELREGHNSQIFRAEQYVLQTSSQEQ